MRYAPLGRKFAITGVLRAISSKRSMVSGMPARLAIATRCTMELVDPPNASTAVTALVIEPSVKKSSGFKSSHTISTMRLPVSVAICA